MDIKIEFLRESKIYFPGEAVSGKLIISKNTETPIDGLYVRMEGKRFANINPNVNYPEEHYFCEESRQAESATVLQPGKNEYPFSFILPKNIPASIEVSRASVEYQIIVTLKVLCEFDKTIRAKFFVEGILNLDDDPSSYESREVKKRKNVGFICKGGHYNVLLKLERLGYSPGEFVPFIANINNATSMDLQVKLFLVRELHFLDGGNFKKILSEYGVLQEVSGPLVLPGEDKIWRGDVFKVPKVAPTHLGCRRLIELNYFMKITVTPARFLQRTLELKVPLIIGSRNANVTLKRLPSSRDTPSPRSTLNSYNVSRNSPILDISNNDETNIDQKPPDNPTPAPPASPTIVSVADSNGKVKSIPIVGISMKNCIVLETAEEEE